MNGDILRKFNSEVEGIFNVGCTDKLATGVVRGFDDTPLQLREQSNPKKPVTDKYGNELKDGETLTPSGNVQGSLF